MKKLGWYERKTIRRLAEMVKLELLEKDKEGIKGARSRYRTTDKTHEYEAYSFFDRIRKITQEKGLINREKESLLIYGLPPRNKLTPLEIEIFDQIVRRFADTFWDLYLLKNSIKARAGSGQQLDEELVKNYLLQEMGDALKQEWWDEVYNGEFDSKIKNLIQFARDKCIEIEAGPFLNIEKQGFGYVYSPWSSFDEACSAILAMLSPDAMKEYALDSYNYLKDTIEYFEQKKLPLSDKNFVLIARDFLRRERLIENPHVRERIIGLRRWPWLRLKIGSEATEKLLRIIYYLWQKYKEKATERATEQESEPVRPEIHVMTEEEENREIAKIIRESTELRI